MRARTLPAAAGLLLAGLSACTLSAPYDKYAIVYGVANYQDPMSDLNYTDDDANAMAALLTGQGYQVILRLDSDATKDNLEITDIPAVAGQAREQDLFVFYFSGHGGQPPAAAGAENPDSDSYNEYIFLHGSDDGSNLGMTFSDDQLVAALASVAARKKVIILDACNSGGYIGNELEADGEPASLVEGSGGLLDQAVEAFRLYANFDGDSADVPPWEALVLSASGEREFSYESPDSFGAGPLLYHGVFTYYLLESEREGDANRDGWVTVTEAFAYTQKMIYRYWNYGYGFPSAAFSPHVSGGPVDYVLFEAR